jgi:peptidoglycan/LPS O-acetylase OafA/YrhL
MDQRLDKDSELAIDALRGIAALMVLFCHAFELGVSEVFGWDPTQTPGLWRFARASLGNGDFWVWCFFAVSGLCIHRSIARSILERRFSWWSYSLARLTRIYPLFLLGFLLAVLAWSLGLEFGSGEVKPAPWPQLAATLLNLQLLTSPFPNFGPSWSLTCEVVYYAVWPLTLLLMGGRVNRAAGLTMISTLSLTAGILLMWRVFHRMESSTLVDGIYIMSVLFPIWIAGAWAGGLWESLKISRAQWFLGLLLCLLVIVMEWILRYKSYPVWGRHLTSWGAIPGLILVLAGCHHLRLSSLKGAQAVCRWLGQLSYPCYILHIPLLVLIKEAVELMMPTATADHPVLLTALETLLLVLLLAAIGPRLERFFMSWRASFLKAVRS